VELDCIVLWGKLFGTGTCMFGGQIVWNWTVEFWGANGVGLSCIGFAGANFVEQGFIGLEFKFCEIGLYNFVGQVVRNWTL
jgi:hypothetical protein